MRSKAVDRRRLFEALVGPRRAGCVLASDRAGNPYWAILDEGVELVDGRVRATGGGGGTLAPLVTGEEPPVFVTDGAGGLIYVSM